MLIFVPIIILLLVASILLLQHFIRPDFRYPWMIAAGGTALALVSVFLWRLGMPQTFSLPAWQPQAIFPYSPTWLADDTSWTFALALAILAFSVIWTSVVRPEGDAITWAGTLLLVALGILAVAAANPLTLVLAWTAMDVAELINMLRFTEGENQTESAVVAFAVRIFGTGLVLWASTLSLSTGTPMDFRAIPTRTGIYLLLAAGLRLGVLPLHLPYRKENVLRRGFGTTLRLVSAAASLALLARIPSNALSNPLTPLLLIFAAAAALYAGWMWLRASDELVGRPFWILGMASLAVAASLRADQSGSAAWGFTLVLSGSFLFLFSARQRGLLWLPVLAIWGISALPYSPTSTGWNTGNHSSWLFLIPLLPAQAFLMAGFFRHSLHPGETSFESQARWAKILYPTGLLLPVGVQALLGIWGWNGIRQWGNWPAAVIALLLAIGFSILSSTILLRAAPASGPGRWTEILRIDWLFKLLGNVYRFLGQIASLITSMLEGEGGILWSLLLLVLILSILSTLNR
jgi:hypothetical protein